MAKHKQKRSGDKEERASLKPDDEALFLSAMKNVEPSDSPRSTASGSAVESTPHRLSGRKGRLPPQPQSAPRKRKTYAPLAAGRSGDVDGRTLDRLKRGQIRPEARLDLHGLTQENAHRELVSFIVEAQASGKRSVIVITGRGRLSEGGGVLRNQTPNWLNAPALRARIIAFATAQPRDGGTGALYVLLRRAR
ncbi:MAG: hypothetical protein CMM52_16960 [Rhodospirillaceae bacterium]|nr:hypothetical protein [Rhodospirillaceae bacterium]|tara:strand:- start:7819 stop:8397 length:579 start_codon:yes stop_codon:yes gene_type:complete